MLDKLTVSSLLVEAGARFRALRKELAWSQSELARRSGVSRDTMNRFEKGGSIELASLAAMLNAMGQRLAFAARHDLRAADMRRKFAHIHEERD